jgi:NLR family CARD domain-containing protein 3
LILKKNSITHEGIKALSTCLSNSLNLKELNVAGNLLGDIGAEVVANSLVGKEFLISVNVSDNKITNDGCIKLMSIMRDIDTIEEFNISGNEVETAGAKAIASALSDK